MRHIILATRNENKLVEVRAALAGLRDWQVDPLPPEVSDVEETGTTFVENAIIKAVHPSALVDGMILADDSGLCIEALDGRPGVFSARYAPTDAERIARVLREMDTIPEVRRNAAFVCALALAQHGKLIWTGEGRSEGRILRSPAGENGFGYDPIFQIPEMGRTMAELTMAEKNSISHRGRALHQLAAFLETR